MLCEAAVPQMKKTRGGDTAVAGHSWKLLDAQVGSDYQEWLQIWDSSPMQLPFAHPDVCRLLTPNNGKLLAAIATDGVGRIFYPFFLREISGSDPESEAADLPNSFDVTTPYGYGGPMHWGLRDLEVSASQFWTHFDTWARKNRVISEFIRFSLFDRDILPYPGRTRSRQVNFVRKLDTPPESMWLGAGYRDVRQGVRRAHREGVEIVIDTAGKFVDDFLNIYLSTMERRSSDDWFRFDRSFFESLHSVLAERYVYIYARLDGRMVAANLVLLGRDTAYGFLRGTLKESFFARPVDLLEVESMKWLYEKGIQEYVIGGGLSAGDSLEFYKRKFAPEGAIPFHTGERIFSQDDYDRLVARLHGQCQDSRFSLKDDADFFPAYRRGIVASETPETCEGAPT